MHDKKHKGDIAVAKVISALTSNGWVVGVLLTEHSRYDLLVEKGGECARLQVKHARLRDGAVCAGLVSAWNDKHGTHVRPRADGDYDMLAMYCPDTDKVYLLPAEGIGTGSIQLRVEPAKNRQQHKVRRAEQYVI